MADDAKVEEPQNDVVGELLASEQAELENLRRTCGGLMSEIGQIEVRKARLIGQIGQLEARADQIMRTATTRFNVPDGTQWQLLPDGKVKIIR